MKQIRRNGGFTLLELLVAMAIFVLLLWGILGAIAPAFRYFAQTSLQTQAKGLANTIMESIAGRAEYASAITLSDSPPSSGQLALEFDGQKLYYYDSTGRKAMFDDGFYGDMIAEIVPEGEGGTQLTISILIKKDGELLHTSTNSLNLQNLPLNTEESKRKIQGTGRRYLIYAKGEALASP